MIKIDLCLCIADLKISRKVELPAVPRVGEQISMELQVANVRSVLWRLEEPVVLVHADLREWNGRPSKPDREILELLLRIFPQPEWYYAGTFPRELEKIFNEEYIKRHQSTPSVDGNSTGKDTNQ